MCGIVGIARIAGTDQADAHWLKDAVARLAHRGPDSSGFFRSPDERVLLGHSRLAIIDTSDAGRQPMDSAEGRFCVVLNGEIYNFRELREDLTRRGHRFASSSDTEVVLNGYIEWGTRVFEKLSGAFAIGIYDSERGALVVGRDRFGEKPLYIHRTKESIVFGSEVKAIACRPGFDRKVDLEALDSFLYVGYGLSDRSMLSGVLKLPPAHFGVFDVGTGAYKETAFWRQPPLEPGASSRSLGGLVDELDERLDAAVQSQMVADVPLGVLLSGGLDSSLITAMATRHGGVIRTFTVRFPESPELDETSHAHLIAQHFGTHHTELDASSITPEVLTILAGQMDDPIADSSVIPTFLVARLVREHCAVALGGDGGDELFGGYPRYSRLLEMKRRLQFAPLSVRRVVSKGLLDFLPTGFRGTGLVQAAGLDFAGPAPVMNVLFSRRHRDQIVPALRDVPLRAEERESLVGLGGADCVDAAIRHDLQRYMPEDILAKVDRASMMTSLEVRAPFLDVALAEFALSKVPTKFKTTATARKILLKELSFRVLPADFDRTRKQGFSVPLGDWLSRDPAWRMYVRTVLDEGRSTIVEKRPTAALMDGLDQGRTNAERIFALVVFEAWCREFDVSI